MTNSNAGRGPKPARRALFFALGACICLATSLHGYAQKIVKFDAPNSGTAPRTGTESTGINVFGTIVGDVTDNNLADHGFIRTRDGKFVEFDVSGAAASTQSPCIDGGTGTCPSAINDFGLVVGSYGDNNGVSHGFLRGPFGKIETFDVSGAGAGSGQGTFVNAVNDFGAVTGYAYDSNYVGHGFVRTIEGKIVPFDVSGAVNGTYPNSINNFGFIVGTYIDAAGFGHVFTRAPDGKTTSFDPPGSLAGPYGAAQAYNNDLGAIAGSFLDANLVVHGFQRSADGKYAEFQLSGNVTDPIDGTFVVALNVQGTTTGWIYTPEAHIFVRSADGKASIFDVPGEIEAPGKHFGSAAFAINAEGAAVGRWRDSNLALHSFILSPK